VFRLHLEGKGYRSPTARDTIGKRRSLDPAGEAGGVEHQHFNTNPDGPSRWMAFVYIPLANHVALHLKQIDVAPGHAAKLRGGNDD
jgi:hypothetical protein